MFLKRIFGYLFLLSSIHSFAFDSLEVIEGSGDFNNRGINAYEIFSHSHDQSVFFIRLNNANNNNTIEGLHHLLEHMLFKGTRKHPKYNAFMEYLTHNDITSNASTYPEYVDFYFRINNEILFEAIPRILAQFNQPLFSPQQISMEMLPFGEELQRNNGNMFAAINDCRFRQKQNIKYVNDVQLMKPESISILMHELYDKLWQPQNVEFFLWSSVNKSERLNILNNVVQNAYFKEKEDVNSDYKPSTKPNHVILCQKATSEHQSIFEINFDLNHYYVNQNIHLYFETLLESSNKGTLLGEIKRNTSFSSINFIPDSHTVSFSFASEQRYTREDAIAAKLILYRYLTGLSHQKYPNEVIKSEVIQKLYPFEHKYNYYSIQYQFTEASKKPFEGQNLNESLIKFSEYLLSSPALLIMHSGISESSISPNYLKKLNNQLNKVITQELKDSETNEYLNLTYQSPMGNKQTSNRKFEKLTTITSSFKVQNINQNSQIKLVSLLLKLRISQPEIYDRSSLSKIKQHFLEKNKAFLNKLKEDYVQLSFHYDNRDIYLKVTSYAGSFEHLLAELLPKLKHAFSHENHHIDTQVEFILLGGVNEKLTHYVKRIISEYFSSEIKYMSNQFTTNNTEFMCSANCIAFTLNFMNEKNAWLFGAVLQQMTANHFFQDIRFEKAISYDANVVLFYNNKTPEIRITISNTKANLNKELYEYLINHNRVRVARSLKEFEKSKQALIQKLENKYTITKASRYYWNQMIEREESVRGIDEEVMMLRNYTFSEFNKAYELLRQTYKKDY